MKKPFITRIMAISSILVMFISACSQPEDVKSKAASSNAKAIAMSNIIVDTHIDVPYRLTNSPANISETVNDGDFDYPRAISGGLNAPFMSIYTSPKLEEKGQSREVAEELIDMVEGIAKQWPDKFAIALSPMEIRNHFEAGIISMPLGMENGSPIEGDLANLQYFYDRGIRYITLAHGLSNHISDSSYDLNRQWDGLSDFGHEVVAEMNRIGLMIDISHVSDDAFWDVIKITEVPVIASHSSARHFTPGFERNMSDDMIIALAANGGVIHINFGSGFITAEAQKYSTARSEASKLFALENPELSETEVYEKFPSIYEATHGEFPYSSIDNVLDHFDHVVALTSINHVGIGSDYDGVGDSLPIGLKDVSSYPALIQGLLDRGYSEDDIQKILSGNTLRVWQAAINFAATKSNNK